MNQLVCVYIYILDKVLKMYVFIFRPKSEVEKYREDKEITLVGENIPKPIFKFEESGFPEIIIKELK